jgi:hypothetical protein
MATSPAYSDRYRCAQHKRPRGSNTHRPLVAEATQTLGCHCHGRPPIQACSRIRLSMPVCLAKRDSFRIAFPSAALLDKPDSGTRLPGRLVLRDNTAGGWVAKKSSRFRSGDLDNRMCMTVRRFGKRDVGPRAEFCPISPIWGGSKLGGVLTGPIYSSTLIFRMPSSGGWTKQMRPMELKTCAKDNTQAVLSPAVWPESLFGSSGDQSDGTIVREFWPRNRFPDFGTKLARDLLSFQDPLSFREPAEESTFQMGRSGRLDSSEDLGMTVVQASP